MAEPLQPAMTGDEIACLTRILDVTTTYLEFGAGGSTALAARLGVPTIWSVESDPKWIDRLREDPDISVAEAAGRVHFHHGDIGMTENLGYPLGYLDGRAKRSASWRTYYSSIWTKIEPKSVDAVLVDGRFRVASTLSVIKRCRPDVQIVIHDFWNRPVYHGLLRHALPRERADTLAVLVPRPVNPFLLAFDRWRYANAAH